MKETFCWSKILQSAIIFFDPIPSKPLINHKPSLIIVITPVSKTHFPVILSCFKKVVIPFRLDPFPSKKCEFGRKFEIDLKIFDFPWQLSPNISIFILFRFLLKIFLVFFPDEQYVIKTDSLR